MTVLFTQTHEYMAETLDLGGGNLKKFFNFLMGITHSITKKFLCILNSILFKSLYSGNAKVAPYIKVTTHVPPEVEWAP